MGFGIRTGACKVPSKRARRHADAARVHAFLKPPWCRPAHAIPDALMGSKSSFNPVYPSARSSERPPWIDNRNIQSRQSCPQANHHTNQQSIPSANPISPAIGQSQQSNHQSFPAAHAREGLACVRAGRATRKARRGAKARKMQESGKFWKKL